MYQDNQNQNSEEDWFNQLPDPAAGQANVEPLISPARRTHKKVILVACLFIALVSVTGVVLVYSSNKTIPAASELACLTNDQYTAFTGTSSTDPVNQANFDTFLVEFSGATTNLSDSDSRKKLEKLAAFYQTYHRTYSITIATSSTYPETVSNEIAKAQLEYVTSLLTQKGVDAAAITTQAPFLVTPEDASSEPITPIVSVTIKSDPVCEKQK